MGDWAMQEWNHASVVWVDEVGPDEMAGHWLVSGSPEISIERVGGGLMLRSSSMTADQIEAAWLCTSVNERLLVANAEARDVVLADLLG